MSNSGASKRKQSSVQQSVTSGGTEKRAKMTTARSNSPRRHSQRAAKGNGGSRGEDSAPANAPQALAIVSNLRNQCMFYPDE
jgi:hypothetical protein